MWPAKIVALVRITKTCAWLLQNTALETTFHVWHVCTVSISLESHGLKLVDTSWCPTLACLVCLFRQLLWRERSVQNLKTLCLLHMGSALINSFYKSTQFNEWTKFIRIYQNAKMETCVLLLRCRKCVQIYSASHTSHTWKIPVLQNTFGRKLARLGRLPAWAGVLDLVLVLFTDVLVGASFRRLSMIWRVKLEDLAFHQGVNQERLGKAW